MRMLKLEDLVKHATSNVEFSIYKGRECLIECTRNDLRTYCNLDVEVDDYWIENDSLYVHVLSEGVI
jgi:hypothetical protein